MSVVRTGESAAVWQDWHLLRTLSQLLHPGPLQALSSVAVLQGPVRRLPGQELAQTTTLCELGGPRELLTPGHQVELEG